MTTYVAFLRGVNVGGKNRLPMAELREALTARGFAGVSTMLQSGNVLLSSADSEGGVAASIGDAIEDAFGLRIGVVTRSAADLAAAADRNPFVAAGTRARPGDAARRVPVRGTHRRRGREHRARPLSSRRLCAGRPRGVRELPRRLRALPTDARVPRAPARSPGHGAELAHGAAARGAHRSPSMKRSAGLLLYRIGNGGAVELLIVHMGGPFWRNRDAGGWSIPKGELEDGETALPVALREFEEELGSPPPPVDLVELGEVEQRSGKRVVAFAGEGDFDADDIQSNTFTIEWPRGSGNTTEFPEVDRAAWVSADEARRKLVAGQVEFVDRLLVLVSAGSTAKRSRR